MKILTDSIYITLTDAVNPNDIVLVVFLLICLLSYLQQQFHYGKSGIVPSHSHCLRITTFEQWPLSNFLHGFNFTVMCSKSENKV